MFDRLRGALREFFLLERARQANARLTPSQRQSVQTFCNAAKRRMAVARGLREPNQCHAGLSLYRGAAWLLTHAVLVSRDETLDFEALSPDAAFQRLAQVLRDEGSKPPAAFDLTRRLMTGPEPLAVERLSTDEAACAIDDFQATSRWLWTLVEPRSPAELLGARLVRILGATVLALGLLAWGVTRLVSPQNIAQGKPARSSSVDFDTVPEGAVDGSKDGRFDFHSQAEQSPWWSVDLERPHRIRSIKVFGRGDCCFDQSIPLTLEASSDGVTFDKIATREQPFSAMDPWVVMPDRLVARVIRLRRDGAGLLVLSEIEIYEARK